MMKHICWSCVVLTYMNGISCTRQSVDENAAQRSMYCGSCLATRPGMSYELLFHAIGRPRLLQSWIAAAG